MPNINAGYLIDSPVAAKPWEYHLMKHYIKSAKKASSWKAIAKNRPLGQLDSAVESWLKSDGILTFTANTMDLLDAALLYVIKKVLNFSGIILVTSAAGTLTLLDRMAMFMSKAAKVASDVSIWVYHLMKKMAALIGITIKEGMDLTASFIRQIFLSLHRKLANMIWSAGKEIN